MFEWLAANPNPTAALIGGLCMLIYKLIDKAAPIIWKQTCNDGLVTQAQLAECIDKLGGELAAGDERMDTGAKVGVFVATWFPVVCRALKAPEVDCRAMEKEADALMQEMVLAGRQRRGAPHGR